MTAIVGTNRITGDSTPLGQNPDSVPAHWILAGPDSGGSAPAAFRAITEDDLASAGLVLLSPAGGTMTGDLDFSGADHAGLRLNNLTTAQRDAVAPALAGMLIYNTTTGVPNAYAAGSWQALLADKTANAIASPAIGSTPLTLNQFSLGQTAALLRLALGNPAGNAGFAGILWERPSSVSANSIPWRAVVNQSYLPGAGVGGANYTNEVFCWGWNIGATVGTRQNSSLASVYDTFESKYYAGSGGVYQWERHFETVTTSSVNQRYMTFSGLYDGSGLGCEMALSRLSLDNLAGDQRILFDWATNDTVDIVDPVTFRFIRSGNPVIYQANSVSAFVPLPYFDAHDVMRYAANGHYMSGERAGTGATFEGTFLALNMTTTSSGDTLLLGAGATVSGSMFAFQMAGAASTGWTGAIYNNSNTSTADAILELRTIGAGGGDAYALFNVNGAGAWYVGLDNSDGDKFKIGTAALGSADVLAIDGSKNVVWTGGKMTFAATTTSYATANMPTGAAPSAPADGDIWREDNTNTGLKIRVNGVTKTITLS